MKEERKGRNEVGNRRVNASLNKRKAPFDTCSFSKNLEYLHAVVQE